MQEKYNKRGLQSLNQNMAHLRTEKKKAYLQYLETKMEAHQIEYKRIRATVKKRNKKNK
jgi:hypothetical protein